jgi:hypothetical protein
VLRDPDYRNAYMKRLDKPTTTVSSDNLLNFKKKTAVPLKVLPKGNLPKSLTSKTAFLWLCVSGLNQTNSSKNQAFHIHLKPEQNQIWLKVK